MTAIELRPEWEKRLVELTVGDDEGPRIEVLQSQRRRIVRGYVDGAFDSETEYEEHLAAIDARINAALNVCDPSSRRLQSCSRI